MRIAEGPDVGDTGSVNEFDQNWKTRKEARYNHWTRGWPRNQIQLAFRSHWILFDEILKDRLRASCLEVGAGRGSISSYFSDHGTCCTLLDTSSEILKIAEQIFKTNGHKAKYMEGNALSLPFPDNSFDVVVSIGLLEHFEDINRVIEEQVRVLNPHGTFLGYIVPERADNVQRYWHWLNKILKFFANIWGFNKGILAKSEVYRSDYGSERYLPLIKKLDVEDIIVTGVYPLPMISHSPEFPFSLLPAPVEFILVRIFELVLLSRKILYKKNPWMCREGFGQAFLISFRKK